MGTPMGLPPADGCSSSRALKLCICVHHCIPWVWGLLIWTFPKKIDSLPAVTGYARKCLFFEDPFNFVPRFFCLLSNVSKYWCLLRKCLFLAEQHLTNDKWWMTNGDQGDQGDWGDLGDLEDSSIAWYCINGQIWSSKKYTCPSLILWSMKEMFHKNMQYPVLLLLILLRRQSIYPKPSF